MKLAFSKFIFSNKKKKGESERKRKPPNQSRIIKLPLMNMVIPFYLLKSENNRTPVNLCAYRFPCHA